MKHCEASLWFLLEPESEEEPLTREAGQRQWDEKPEHAVLRGGTCSQVSHMLTTKSE